MHKKMVLYTLLCLSLDNFKSSSAFNELVNSHETLQRALTGLENVNTLLCLSNFIFNLFNVQ